MPADALNQLVDAGDAAGIAAALRGQRVRLGSVVAALDRTRREVAPDRAAHLVAALIAAFRFASAGDLAAPVLDDPAGVSDAALLELATALLALDRLSLATRAVELVLARTAEAPPARALLLRARLLARAGRASEALATVAHLGADDFGPEGVLERARWALLAGRGAPSRVAALDAVAVLPAVEAPDLRARAAEIEAIRIRAERASGLAERVGSDLRASWAIEYGSALIELAAEGGGRGRFGAAAISYKDVGRLVGRMLGAITAAQLPFEEVTFATADGAIVAAAIARITGKAVHEWSAERPPLDGTWLCMGSVATHPELPNPAVRALQAALDEGTLRSLALLLPFGTRGPLVPDFVGRLTVDDELPWRPGDGEDDVVDRLFTADDNATDDLVRDDEQAIDALMAEARAILRASAPPPRPPHVPYRDETPV